MLQRCVFEVSYICCLFLYVHGYQQVYTIIFLFAGDILVFGGELSTPQSFDSRCKVLSNDFERYDSTQRQWEVVGNLLQPRAAAAAVVVKSKVYFQYGDSISNMYNYRSESTRKLHFIFINLVLRFV